MGRQLSQFAPFGRSAFLSLALAGLGGAAPGCGDEKSAESPDLTVPETYTFESSFDAGKSSVSYSGQVLRHMLIKSIDDFIGGLTESIDSGEFAPKAGDVRGILDSYYAFDSQVSGEQALPMSSGLPLVQKSFDDLSTGKDLKGKFAGNGGDTEHKNWKTEFRGFAGVKGAETLLVNLFDQLDALAVARAGGAYEVDVATPVYITAEGLDLKEMIEKLLLVGIAYSQATDKYLDEELATDDNTQLVADGKEEPYSAIQHAWDEAFGYFGAPRDYGAYSDEDLAADGGSIHDTNDDGKIDLLSEVAFAPAVYAARRDVGSQDPTDFTGDIWTAFREGRAVLATASERLTEQEQETLLEERDKAVAGFENVLAANVVHYLNETLVDLGGAASGDFKLTSLAAHFSELKAFSLGLQLNPRSRLAGKAFDTFQAKVGSAPVLPEAGPEAVNAYRKALLEARDVLQTAYDFPDANMGDDDGVGGW